MTELIIPDFYCPFPAEIHPRTQEIHEQTLAWALEHQLLQGEAAIRRFHLAKFSELAGRTYPRTCPAMLLLINQFFTWLFMLDDQFDESQVQNRPELIEHMQNIVDRLLLRVGIGGRGQSEPLPGPLGVALQDFWEQSCALATPQWQRRFAEHLRAYLDAYIWEIGNRCLGQVPPIATYLEKRQDAGAMRLALDYIDLSERVTLPPEIYQSTLVQALLLATNNVVCWQNDIVSVLKERAFGDGNNLVLVLQQARSCSLQQAIYQVNDMTTLEVKLFEQLCALIPRTYPEHSEAIEKYLGVMRAWMRGNIDWSFSTSRYQQIDQPVQGEQPDYLEVLFPDQ